MLLRPSMDKFNSPNHNVIEVCGYSAPHKAYLNRQIINLLSCLGVRDDVFINMQAAVERTILKASQCPESAKQLLQNFTGEALPMSDGLSYSHSAVDAAVQMLNRGFATTEPLVQLVIDASQKWVLKELRSRARIPVTEGALLMGVADETQTLQYGEVFIQVSGRIVEGLVVIAKNPCLHPGDIRVLNAVTGNLTLRQYMHDVVVFPVNGSRPHPDECSGSDLDGDMYFCSWDPHLLPQRRNLPPLDYTKPASQTVEVTMEGLAQFLVDYISNTDLGSIANAHLALSDYRLEGPEHPDCIALARLHAQAVDFQKTGVSATLPNQLRPDIYPDYMEKGGERTYESKRVLGKLFRRARDIMKTTRSLLDPTKTIGEHQTGVFLDERHNRKDCDLASLINWWRACEDLIDWENSAWYLVDYYYRDVVWLLHRHEVDEVGYLVTGLLPDFPLSSGRKRRNRPDKRGDLLRDLGFMLRRQSQWFWLEFGGPSQDDDDKPRFTSLGQLLSADKDVLDSLLPDVIRGALACYTVGSLMILHVAVCASRS